jgi:hypothetical protein
MKLWNSFFRALAGHTKCPLKSWESIVMSNASVRDTLWSAQNEPIQREREI